MNTLLTPDLSYTFICMKHKTQSHGAGFCWNLEDINQPTRAACKNLVFHVTPASVSSLVSYLRHILGFLLCCFQFLSKAGRKWGLVKKSQTETNALNERLITLKTANFSTSSFPLQTRTTQSD
jgi:hypothetical protein